MVTDPAGPVGRAFMELGAAVVREVAKAGAAARNTVGCSVHGRARMQCLFAWLLVCHAVGRTLTP